MGADVNNPTFGQEFNNEPSAGAAFNRPMQFTDLPMPVQEQIVQQITGSNDWQENSAVLSMIQSDPQAAEQAMQLVPTAGAGQVSKYSQPPPTLPPAPYAPINQAELYGEQPSINSQVNTAINASRSNPVQLAQPTIPINPASPQINNDNSGLSVGEIIGAGLGGAATLYAGKQINNVRKAKKAQKIETANARSQEVQDAISKPTDIGDNPKPPIKNTKPVLKVDKGTRGSIINVEGVPFPSDPTIDKVKKVSTTDKILSKVPDTEKINTTKVKTKTKPKTKQKTGGIKLKGNKEVETAAKQAAFKPSDQAFEISYDRQKFLVDYDAKQKKWIAYSAKTGRLAGETAQRRIQEKAAEVNRTRSAKGAAATAGKGKRMNAAAIAKAVAKRIK